MASDVKNPRIIYTPFGCLITWKDWAVMLGVITFLITVLGSTLYLLLMERYCAESAAVISIGGCNRERCGVILDNGFRTQKAVPTIGERICVRYDERWRFGNE